MTGWRALFYKEVLRFWKVGFQTVGAPVLTSVLYLLIFGHVLEDHVKVYDGVAVLLLEATVMPVSAPSMKSLSPTATPAYSVARVIEEVPAELAANVIALSPS